MCLFGGRGMCSCPCITLLWQLDGSQRVVGGPSSGLVCIDRPHTRHACLSTGTHTPLLPWPLNAAFGLHVAGCDVAWRSNNLHHSLAGVGVCSATCAVQAPMQACRSKCMHGSKLRHAWAGRWAPGHHYEQRRTPIGAGGLCIAAARIAVKQEIQAASGSTQVGQMDAVCCSCKAEDSVTLTPSHERKEKSSHW